MADFPENEKLINTEAENTAFDEDSTVFSNPVEHTKKADGVKAKKRLPIVLASLLSVAVLVGGTIAVIKLIPEKQEDESSVPSIEAIEVLDMKADELKTITVTNENGSFQIYSEKESTKSESSSTEVTNWYLNGYDKDVVSTSSISQIASTTASISASREVTERTAADCGLETPSIKADVVTEKDETFSVLIGDESPDKSGYYLKLSNSDKIYVVDSTVQSSLNFTALSLADLSSMPLFETDDTNYRTDESGLVTFDSLTISGKNFPNTLLITPNNDNRISEYAQFIVSSPEERIADNVDKVFAIFNNGLSVIGAYSFDTSAKSLAATGLDNPDFVATMKIKDKSLTYKFKLQEDGYYAAICDGVKLIKMVDPSSIEFINYNSTDFYSSWVCLNSIDDLKAFTYKVGDKTYEFGITANPDEESEDSYIVTIDGKTIKSSTFQNFYQQCVSLSCNDFTVQNLTAQPEISIIFTFKDEIGGQQKVDFVKSDASRYQFSLNGIAMGRVNSSMLNQLTKTLETMYNAK